MEASPGNLEHDGGVVDDEGGLFGLFAQGDDGLVELGSGNSSFFASEALTPISLKGYISTGATKSFCLSNSLPGLDDRPDLFT